MYLRDAPTMTLATLSDSLDRRVESMTVAPGEVAVDSVSGTIRVKDEERPITPDSLESLATYVGIPKAFHKRLPNDLRDTLFNELLLRQHESAIVRFTDSEIVSMRLPSVRTIEPRRFIDVASRVLSPDSPVIDFRNDSDFFSFDAIVPEGFDRGVGGDPKVGDITRAGLRFGQDVKHNLAPWVQRYMYRLVCTNGMEVPDQTLKIDARGNTVDDVLRELEAMAQLAFAKVEADMAHFYDLRNEVVEHPERTMARIANEHGLSDRLRLNLVDAVPTIVNDDGEVTMFDLVNLATNMANSPAIRVNGVRRELERFGGAVTTFHAERCRTCSTRLN